MSSPRTRQHDPSSPTERTPLLGSSSYSRQDDSSSSQRTLDGPPHIGSFVGEMRLEDLQKYSVDNLYPSTLQSHSVQIAFSLCALLYLRTYLHEASPRGRDISVQWRQERRNTCAVGEVDNLVGRVWERFLEEDVTPEDVVDVLWSAFPLYPDSKRTVRVVEYLASGDAPQELLCHPLIHLSLKDTWSYGLPEPNSDASTASHIFRFVDGTATPQLLHFIDLIIYLGYLGVLFSYLIDPPFQAEGAISNVRGVLILLYAFSRLCRPRSTSVSPFVLVLLSFVTSFPLTPLATSNAYFLLLLSFSWKVILLHLPVHPSPLFLLSPSQILPLAVLVWRGIARTFVPVVTFFLPGLFISLVLLSVSLQDKFLRFSTAVSTLESPMGARVVFLSLFTITFLFLCCALGFSVLVHPFLSPQESAPSTWDRYSRNVGLEARQTYTRVITTYATPHYFPAPFNILQLLFIQLPRSLLVLLGWKSALEFSDYTQKVLWRITVAPFTFLLSALWLWNLHTRR